MDCGADVTKQARPRGIVAEGERITVYEVPLHEARAWLDRRSQEGVVIDLKVYAGLYFAGRPRRTRRARGQAARPICRGKASHQN